MSPVHNLQYKCRWNGNFTQPFDSLYFDKFISYAAVSESDAVNFFSFVRHIRNSTKDIFERLQVRARFIDIFFPILSIVKVESAPRLPSPVCAVLMWPSFFHSSENLVFTRFCLQLIMIFFVWSLNPDLIRPSNLLCARHNRPRQVPLSAEKNVRGVLYEFNENRSDSFRHTIRDP